METIMDGVKSKQSAAAISKRLFCIVFLLIIACVGSGCSSNNAMDEQLVGKWQYLGGGPIWEFTSNGELSINGEPGVTVEVREGVITYWPNTYMETVMWRYEFPKDEYGKSQSHYLVLSQYQGQTVRLVRIS